MTIRTRMLIPALLAALALPALADSNPGPDRGDRVDHRLDRRGERIDHRLDQHGPRADRRGDRIGNRLDRRGDRFERRFDRRHAHRG